MAAAFLPLAILVSILAAAGAATAGAATAEDYGQKPAKPEAPKGDHKVVVWVEGMVYCQSCAHRDSWCLDGAVTLPGAKVMVTCRNAKNRVVASQASVADGNGYFLAQFDAASAADYYMGDPAKACFVRLLSSPDRKCDDLSNLNYGTVGAPLRDEGKPRGYADGHETVVYSAGPFSFRPASCAPTRHY